MIVICDIDGTLALMCDRGPFEWDKVGGDYPNWPVVNLIRQLRYNDLFFVSGRMEQCRELTLEWLRGTLSLDSWIPNNDLYMREDGDYRPDFEIKKEIWMEHFDGWAEKGNTIVLDDRNQTVKMWRELGLTCFQVGFGDF